MANEPQFELLYEVNVDLGAPADIGDTPHGHRLIVPIVGGTFEGPHLKGKALSGGADCAVVRPDGFAELDVRATLETDDGALVYVTYRGLISRIMDLLPRWSSGQAIPREEYYFMVTPSFETGSQKYKWMEQTIAVGIGEFRPGGVIYRMYAVGSQAGASPLPQLAAATA